MQGTGSHRITNGTSGLTEPSLPTSTLILYSPRTDHTEMVQKKLAAEHRLWHMSTTPVPGNTLRKIPQGAHPAQPRPQLSPFRTGCEHPLENSEETQKTKFRIKISRCYILLHDRTKIQTENSRRRDLQFCISYVQTGYEKKGVTVLLLFENNKHNRIGTSSHQSSCAHWQQVLQYRSPPPAAGGR